ncbi:hypothetical protein MJH12_03350 [bacterium]|nr:hypothetical protein [bacterium]
MLDDNFDTCMKDISIDLSKSLVLTEAILEKSDPKISLWKILRTFIILYLISLCLSQFILFIFELLVPINLIDFSTLLKNPGLFSVESVFILIEKSVHTFLFLSCLFSFMVCICFPEFSKPANGRSYHE